MSNSITHENGATVFSGRLAVDCFRAIAIANALELYARTGMKASRMYTPKNMFAAASQITGKTFKRGQYLQAAAALRATAAEVRGHIAEEQDARDADNSRSGIFKLHNCSKCNNGERPCVNGQVNTCGNPVARNH